MKFKARNLLAAVGMVALLAGAPAPVSAQGQDKIRIGEVYNVTTLDPIRSASGANIATFGQLYSRLLRIDENGELAPSLAESWKVSDDGKTITLHLRDAQFSNGDPITAEDAAFSLMRALKDEASAYTAPLQAMDSAVAVDDKTLKVTLLYPFAPFLGNLEVFNTGIVSKKDIGARGADAAFATVPVSSGPYMVEKWTPNDRLELLPNPHYWREGYPKNGGVEIIEVPDENTRVSMILAGDVDVAREVPWSQVAMLQAREGISVPLEPSTAINIVQVNHSRPPFDDLKFRQAAAQAVDAAAFTQAMTFGKEAAGRKRLRRVGNRDHDPQQSREREKMAVAVAGAMGGDRHQVTDREGRFGHLVEPGPRPPTTTPRRTGGTTKRPIRTWPCGGHCAAPCGNKAYYTFYNSKKVDDLIETAARKLDSQKRRDDYYKIQEITTPPSSRHPTLLPAVRQCLQRSYRGRYHDAGPAVDAGRCHHRQVMAICPGRHSPSRQHGRLLPRNLRAILDALPFHDGLAAGPASSRAPRDQHRQLPADGRDAG